MNIITRGREKWREVKADSQLQNEKRRLIRLLLSFLMSVFRLVLIVGISYVILGPLLGILSSSFFSDSDKLNPVVYLIPQSPTLERYRLALLRLDYWRIMLKMLVYVVSLSLIQIGVCSVVGYGLARFEFPLKKIVFACVIITIVIPAHSIMLPLYMSFRMFDPLWLLTLFTGGYVNLLSTPVPMFILTLFGCGLRSGLYIYIFVQFFRGLPKEIEEASFVDGAGTMYTFIRVMIPNAMPSIVTVALFSLVWQYNDLFYANVFNISSNIIIGKRLASLPAMLGNLDQVKNPQIAALFTYAGIILMILPMVIIYVFMQRRFIEGVERSGIVG